MDITKIKSEALKEIQEEKATKAKGQIKAKLKQLEDARLIVRNIERELEDLYDELDA